MDLDFIDELPTVFNILKFNPGAVIDDTAIERLLSWLEEICAEKKPKLVEKSMELFKSEEIWTHPLTLSFSLRFAGFLGYYYGPSTDQLVTVIKDMLLEVRRHKQFSEANVQYGFYKCLAYLSKDIFWYELLECFLNTTQETFKKSYLYVKKAAVRFFASFLHTLLLHESPSLIAVCEMTDAISDPEQLHQIVESVLLISEIDVDLSLKYLSRGKLIKSLMSNMKSSHDVNTNCQLLQNLASIFSMLTKQELNVDWQIIISEDNPEEFLLDFIKEMKSNSELKMFIPLFCKSLMTYNNTRCFTSTWNHKLLQIALLDISYHHNNLKELLDCNLHDIGNVLSVKVWKKLLIVTLGEMIMMEKKLFMDPLCQKLLKAWRSYCLKILTVSLSNTSDGQVIDEYLITVMYDKKIPRLCFQYLKELDFEVFDKELKKQFLDCLWNCLVCHTDIPQVVCATLELLSRFISQNENNISELIQNPSLAESSVNNMYSYTLAEVLNKLLWDTNWEIQDSLIDVLLHILENAKAGSQVCNRFLKENPFWVKVIDLINNKESYIRSKTVSFIGAVVMYKPAWDIFCNKSNYCLLDLWKLLTQMFTCEERQDDMFTRRSILQVINLWILSKLDYVPILLSYSAVKDTTNISGYEEVKTYLFKILENGSNDFDWEVRKLTFSSWTDMAKVASECSKPDEKEFFINCLVDNNFALALCNGVTDCEYLVKMEAFKCLTFIIHNFLNISKRDTANPGKTIQTITEYENILKSFKDMDRNRFKNFVEQINLEEIGKQLDILDVKVNTDPVSFIQDVIASSKQSEANLLDCY